MIPRQLAIQTLADHLSDEAVVTGLGFVAMDLQTHADRALNFYIWGAMGSAVSVALGLALARPDVRVVSVDGDGSTLMNLGALSTVGRYAPSNLAVIVLDNGQFQITGGQATAAQTTDLAAVGRACGIAQSETVETEDSLVEALHAMERGPRLIVVKVDEQRPDNPTKIRQPVMTKYRFMSRLGTLEHQEFLERA